MKERSKVSHWSKIGDFDLGIFILVNQTTSNTLVLLWWLNDQTLESDYLAPLFSSCMSLRKLLECSIPPFPLHQMGKIVPSFAGL